MKKKIIIVLGFAFCMSAKTTQAELKVLFIGNSFTNQIQGTLRSLIQASPYSESTIEYVAPDSWTLQQHSQSSNTMSRIRNSNWDFVVLQEQSFRATLPGERTQFYSAVATLSEAVKESGAQVILYMTWGWRYGDTYHPNISPDYKTMQQLFIESYTEAARQVDAIIAPVGLAWQSVRKNNPDLGGQLYKGDNYHPSNKGAFLIACVFYATLFDADPTELAFNGSLSAEEAAYLRKKAAEVVTPIVDLNGDGIVDAADMCIMVDYWGTDEPLCDIGPMPWGDGIVDVEDIKVLAEYLFTYPGTVVHWALDEAEGIIAADSVSETGYSDGIVTGDPVWQPAGGQVNGAIQLDGIDDFIIVSTVLNPADGPFSIFAWINGGGPGQVIVSQQAMANWLQLDTAGNLMTDLKCTGRSAGPLYCGTVITDGQWHRIGLVWDGSNRILYVDDVAVAEDIPLGLEDSQMGLCIGTGKAMEPGTYFSGLIDDVRIYNRVITP